ncbi:hypothetical protein F5Y17DRAFT_447188 [Xylariaceae sp. FL0594]|nr:hypothetical protein F5Y17DRAFT_447188 [Xylariaceae sp. FL0594]
MGFFAAVVAALLSSSSILSSASAAPALPTPPEVLNTSIIGNIDSFSTSCYEYRAYQMGDNIYLSASCTNKSGAWVHTYINLNRCLYNNFGRLEARKDGNFGYSCDRMVQHGESSLYGYCDNGKEPVYAVIDLGPIVENYDGHLSCFGYGDESQDPTNT